MKKIFLSLSFLLSLVVSFAQPRIVRSSDVNTVYDVRLGAIKNFFPPTYADTAEANLSFNIGLDSIGALIFNASTNSYWYRADNPKRWLEVGGAVNFQNSQSVIVTGSGQASDPYIAQVPVSGEPNNIFRFNTDGAFVPSYIQNGLIEGGFISNVPGSYTYDVMPARYGINSVEFTSPETQVTLANSDPTFNRIDIIAVTTSGTVVTITGTPSSNPQEPSYDPLTTLPLRFILVEAATAAPPSVTSEYIYRENVEWTTAPSNATINPASTLNPFSPVLDVEGTDVLSGHLITFTDPTPPTNLTNYIILTLKIRSKGAWPNTSRVEFRFYNGASPVGNVVALSNSTFGFNSGNTTGYQTVTFAIPTFGLITNATALYYTVVHLTGSGHSIGFHLDDIQLQGGPGTGIPVTGRWWSQGGDSWSSLGILGTNDNFNLQFKTNNTFHTQLMTNGSTWMQGVNPGISLFLGTLTSSDYFWQRVGTTFTTNSAGAYATKLAGNNIYTYNVTDGHYWYGPAASFAMRLNSSNELEINSGAVDAGDYRLQVTGGVRIDATSKNITLVGLPTDNTSTQVAAKDGSGNLVWRDVSSITGAAVTASNGLTMVGNDVQLFGTLTKLDTIDAQTFNLRLQGTGGSGVLRVQNSAAGSAIVGLAATGVAGFFSSSSGLGLQASGSTLGGLLAVNNTVNNAVTAAASLSHGLSSGSAAIGIGVGLNFSTSAVSSTASLKIESVYTNITGGAQETRVDFNLFHGSDPSVHRLTMSGYSTGAWQMPYYGDGNFTSGTPTYATAWDANGNLMEIPIGGGSLVYTANNGLTMTSNNIQLGGPLIQSSIITNSGFNLTVTGTDGGLTVTDGVFIVNNTTSPAATNGIVGTSAGVNSRAIYGYAPNGVGLYGEGSNGVYAIGLTTGTGVTGTSPSGTGVSGHSDAGVGGTFSVLPSSTNTIVSVASLSRYTTGTAANGIGGTLDYYMEADDGVGHLAGRIGYKLTDAAVGTLTSSFELYTVNSGISSAKLSVLGSGQVRLYNYGVNTFAGVAAYVLGVDASGNVVEVAAAGAGMTNPFTTGGQIIYSVGTTPTALNIGTPGQVLTVNGGGTAPIWTTLAGGGSVQDVDVITANGFAGTVANSTTLPDITITTTVTGILKGNGIAISAATPGTDYLTVLTGDVTTSGNAATLATVNSNVGSFGSSTSIPSFTVNSKGLITAASSNAVIAPAGTLTGTTLASNVVTSSLTTVGIIGAGTWQGTAIADGFIASSSTWNSKQAGDATLTDLAGMTVTSGAIIYGVGADNFSLLPVSTDGFVLTLVGGLPAWTAAGTGTMQQVTLTQPSSGFTITNSGVPQTTTASFTFALNNDLAAVEGLATTGIIRRTGTNAWTAGGLVSLTSEVAGTLPVANGGTGISSLTPGRILVTNTATTFSQVIPTDINGIVVTMAAGNMSISQNYNHIWQTLTDGAVVTWNVANGANANWTLGGTGRTLNIVGAVDGQTYTLRAIQGSGGLKTVTTWPTGSKWQNGGTPIDLSDAAGAWDMISFKYQQSTGFFIVTYGLNFQ